MLTQPHLVHVHSLLLSIKLPFPQVFCCYKYFLCLSARYWRTINCTNYMIGNLKLPASWYFNSPHDVNEHISAIDVLVEVSSAHLGFLQDLCGPV